MGLAILVIVLGIAGYFSDLGFQASERTFNDSLKSAVNAPNGAPVMAKNLKLDAGDRSTGYFSKQSAIPAGCFSVDALQTLSIVLYGNERVEFKQPLEITVFFRCVLGSGYASASDELCEESCLVSFGKEIDVLPEGEPA